MSIKFETKPLTSVEIQELYYDLAQTSQDLIWQCDVQGRYTYLNPSWETTFGYTIDEMIGRSFSDFQSLEIAKRDLAEFAQILLGGSVTEYESITLSKSGKKIHVVLNAKCARDAKGVIVGARGTAYNITQRKQAEENLKIVANRFQSMIDNAPLGAHLYELQPDNRLIFSGANQSADTILQVKNNQFIGKTIEEAFPNLAATDVPESYKKVAHTGEPFNSEQIIYADDKGIAGAFEIAAFQTAPHKMAVLFRDVTEKKKMEEALFASERRFKELVRNASDSVTVLNKDRIQIYVSDVVEKMVGFKPIELTNIPVIETMIHPEDKQRVEETFLKILHEGQGIVAYRHKHKNGSWVHLEAWGTNQLENPDIRGVVVNVRDITERKLAEEEREKLNQQINQMQKLESLGLLAGGIAHDFNNLLGGMFGFVELAKLHLDDNKPHEARDELIEALGVFERTKALTRQLLTFAKGGAPIRFPRDLTPLIKTSAQFALSGSTVSSTCSIAQDLWACDCDENQIGQVIDNIIINAQQAMPLGGTILISAENMSIDEKRVATGLQAGNFVKISIKDKGIGIAKDLLPKIFDPFFTTKAMGHGLGLATVYSIVKRHGGWIEVESEPGTGTTFLIFLPASQAKIFTEQNTKANEYKSIGRILIMDDESFMRDTESAMLKSIGFEVAQAKDGQEALALFSWAHANGKPFIVSILDLTIPNGMGGEEAVKEILKIDKTAIVIVSSGYADDPVMMSPADYGFTAKIEKPFRRAELIKMLSENLK